MSIAATQHVHVEIDLDNKIVTVIMTVADGTNTREYTLSNWGVWEPMGEIRHTISVVSWEKAREHKDVRNIDILDQYLTEVEKNAARIVPVNFKLIPLLALIGQLQLALRHPNNTGASTNYARVFISQIVDELRYMDMPTAIEVIRRGFDPNYDEQP